MNKYSANRESRSTKVITRTLVALSALTLVACEASRQETREEITNPVTRIDYDFGGSTKFGNGSAGSAQLGRKCLVGTPYDPVTNKEGTGNSALVTTEEIDGQIVATITPPKAIYPNAQPLKLVGFENTEDFLAPADDDSTKIFNDYGCFEE